MPQALNRWIKAGAALIASLPLLGHAQQLITQPVAAQPAPPPLVAPAPVVAPQPAVPLTQMSSDERLARLERQMSSQALGTLLMRIDQLQQEVQSLTGAVEEQNHAVKTMQQRQRDLYVDMDRRLRRIEVTGIQPVATASTPTPAVPTVSGDGTAAVDPSAQTQAATPAIAAIAIDPAEERKAYQQAFNMLKEGRYPMAIEAFQSFVAAYPEGNYADNAQYWLGEARYVSRDFTGAISEFHKVLEQHPDSSKMPDAMLKIGYARYELGEWELSKAVLNDVVQRYPNSTAARLSQKRLQRIKREGY